MKAHDSMEQELEEILARDVDDVRREESEIFDQLTGEKRSKLVLCGAGGLGRKMLAGLRHVGIEALCFADNNPALAGRTVEGLQVVGAPAAVEKFGREAAFVVTVWGAHSGDRLAERKAHWQALGCEKVISFMPLFWKFPQEFLPHYSCDLPHRVFAHADFVRKAGQLWADDASRAEFNAQVRWRTQLDFDQLPDPVSGPAYFSPDVVRLQADERFLDCGAFDGDTLRDFLRESEGRFGKYWALEPDPANFEKLRALVASVAEPVKERIEVFPIAASNRKQTLRFAAAGSASSALDATGDLEVQGERLDVLLGNASPTFIKMDIEGVEPEALEGCAGLLARARPIVAVSAYHLQEHLWELPLQLAATLRDYRFYLRPHDLEGWDLVLYAVPSERCVPDSEPAVA
ncbi:MAG: FkbM family methyltransferase [Chthoniobacterales bacterium]|nr:FkbM family methyltransferase [Chthoniobacterales bacterium]